MAGVKGDFDKLGTLITSLKRPNLAALARAIGKESVLQIQTNIKEQQDPYGKPWPKGQKGKPVLRGLGRKFSFKSDRTQVTVTCSDPVAIFHHLGTVHIPQRMLVPTPRRGLPLRWKQAFRQVARKHFLRVFFGK